MQTYYITWAMGVQSTEKSTQKTDEEPSLEGDIIKEQKLILLIYVSLYRKKKKEYTVLKTAQGQCHKKRNCITKKS